MFGSPCGFQCGLSLLRASEVHLIASQTRYNKPVVEYLCHLVIVTCLSQGQ